MNPILAGSLVSLGKDLLQNVVSSASKGESPADAESFRALLAQASENNVAGANEAGEVMSRLGIENVTQAEEVRSQLEFELLARPEVAAFQAQHPNSPLRLGRSADGSFVLSAGPGQTLRLDPRSEASASAGDLLSLSHFLDRGLDPDHPGEVLLKG